MKPHSLRILRAVFIAVIFVWTASAHGQGTAFTYQGRLSDSSGVAAGNYDLRFTLYDVATGGTIVAGPITNAATSLSNGLFAVTLDFGAGVFTGGDRWLEIGVRTNGSGTFTALEPRQQVTSAPYAVRAATASTATSATVASAVGVNAVNADGLQVNSVKSDKIEDGTIEAADLSASLLSGTFWRLDGNVGLTGAFLGTVNSQPLDFRVNNGRLLRLETAPEVGNVIGGAAANSVSPGVRGATIAGGGLPSFPHTITADYAAIGGGTFHEVYGPWGTIAGGRDNRVRAEAATVAGGRANGVQTNATYAFVGGGLQNQIGPGASFSTISGGGVNSVGEASTSSVIAGGGNHRIGTNSGASVISGGSGNAISNDTRFATIAGGAGNTVHEASEYASIGGGRANRAGAAESTVAGGAFNNALGFSSAVGGGGGHRVDGSWALIAGGRDNLVTSNSYATISGGRLNIISNGADYATIPGGFQNRAIAPYTFAAGYRAWAQDVGSFVWSDNNSTIFTSTASNQFNVRATGGVRIQSNPGIQLNAADTPLITRGWDAFTSDAPSFKQGHGRWGLFMEPLRLVIGIPSNDIPNRYFQVAKYSTNGTPTTLMQVDQEGNVSANAFIGSGASLSGVNADTLDGWDSSAFSQVGHQHFGESWSGANDVGLTLTTTSASGFGVAALRGRQGAGAGVTYGVRMGLWGETEEGWGVFGISAGASGRGVSGVHYSETGIGSGVLGFTRSINGRGVAGDAGATNGVTFGVLGQAASTSGSGVRGIATATNGVTTGVGAYNSSDAGRAIYAEATAGAGTTYAVRGHVSSPDGYGAYFTGASGSRNYFQHNVGIGVIGATFQLQLGLNSAAKPGGGSWTASSDARLKKNVTTIGGSLDKLLQLRGVSYEWIDPDSQGGMDGSYPGFIAQEVEQVFPEWVGTDAEGFKTLTIFGFEGVAVEALRELRAEKDAEITELKKELAELKELVSALAEQVQAQRFNPK